MSDELIEMICRTICKAENVDPDAEGLGCGILMTKDQKYKLWEARKRVAKALLNEFNIM